MVSEPNQKKTSLQDLVEMLPRFRDQAKFFQDPRFSGYHSPPLCIAHIWQYPLPPPHRFDQHVQYYGLNRKINNSNSHELKPFSLSLEGSCCWDSTIPLSILCNLYNIEDCLFLYVRYAVHTQTIITVEFNLYFSDLSKAEQRIFQNLVANPTSQTEQLKSMVD